MKVFGFFAKLVLALAAVAGIAFAVVNYGDQIVAWFKKVFGDMCCCCDGQCCCGEADGEDEVSTIDEVVQTEVAPEEGHVTAADGDFEG